MCGIAGAINWGTRELLDRMTQSISHRGRDDSGLWDEVTSDGSWIGLGHRRLSILDLSSAGHQPMFSENGRFGIVFNGEIYNYGELRDELRSVGCHFKSNTDTEVVLRLYERHQEGCLEHLRGMFAFAIAISCARPTGYKTAVLLGGWQPVVIRFRIESDIAAARCCARNGSAGTGRLFDLPLHSSANDNVQGDSQTVSCSLSALARRKDREVRKILETPIRFDRRG